MPSSKTKAQCTHQWVPYIFQTITRRYLTKDQQIQQNTTVPFCYDYGGGHIANAHGFRVTRYICPNCGATYDVVSSKEKDNAPD